MGGEELLHSNNNSCLLSADGMASSSVTSWSYLMWDINITTTTLCMLSSINNSEIFKGVLNPMIFFLPWKGWKTALLKYTADFRHLKSEEQYKEKGELNLVF